jgi:hypothetical protein
MKWAMTVLKYASSYISLYPYLNLGQFGKLNRINTILSSSYKCACFTFVKVFDVLRVNFGQQTN